MERRTPESQNPQTQLAQIQKPRISLGALAASFGRDALNEALPFAQRTHAARLAMLTRHLQTLAIGTVKTCARNAEAIKGLDDQVADLVQMLAPTLTAKEPQPQPPAGTAQPGIEEGPTEERTLDEEAAAMAELAQRETAEEVAAIEAMAQGEEPPAPAGGGPVAPKAPMPSVPGVRKPAGRKVPPVGPNGGTP